MLENCQCEHKRKNGIESDETVWLYIDLLFRTAEENCMTTANTLNFCEIFIKRDNKLSII